MRYAVRRVIQNKSSSVTLTKYIAEISISVANYIIETLISIINLKTVKCVGIHQSEVIDG
jgi:hypothetical protein